jgi:hypothetical protein
MMGFKKNILKNLVSWAFSSKISSQDISRMLLVNYIIYKSNLLMRSSLLSRSPFLAHLAKGNVSFCHHLMSGIRRLSSVNFSHFNFLLMFVNGLGRDE